MSGMERSGLDEERIKQAVLAAIERTVDARALALAVEHAVAPTRSMSALPPPPESVPPAGAEVPGAPAAVQAGTQKLLTRIVLGDLLDDAILGARPQDRAFPLRLFFSELGSLLASTKDAESGPGPHVAESAFTLASGLNFFLRATMDPEAKVRVGLEVSKQLYSLASLAAMDAEVVSKAAPLLAQIMSQDLERTVFESVDHARVFDSQVHERTAASDPTGARIVRPASFLARVATNNAVKVKAQVVT